MHLTAHAQTRKQQRSISDLEIELLMLYGSDQHQGEGITLTYLDKKGFERLERDIKRVYKRLEKLRYEYLVNHGESVITVGHRFKSIPRP